MLVYNYTDSKLYKYREVLDVAPTGEKMYDVQIIEISAN